VPEIVVKIGATRSKGIEIGRIRWAGMICRVHVDGAEGYTVDIRWRPADAGSSVTTGSRTVSIEGNASLTVEDDSNEGKEAWLVVLDSQNAPVAQRAVRIGLE